MGGQLKFDTKQFETTMRKYLATTSKSMVRALNSKAYDIAWHAEKFTRRASKAAIESLGVIGTRLRKDRKTGVLKKGAAIHAKSSLARAIVIGRRRKAGQDIETKSVEQEARQLVNKRLRAIGYLASGWLPAIRKMFHLSDIKHGKPTSKKRAGTIGTGRGIPATKGKQVAIIENSLKALKDGKAGRTAESALARAFRIAQADMEKYLIKKFKGAAKENGIQTR